ncbi:MAG: hypothetical protein OEY00_05190 [Gammaproteobacteria bacterium]|nr:hypothetical protein [Gammaproteobacteria bacterium]
MKQPLRLITLALLLTGNFCFAEDKPADEIDEKKVYRSYTADGVVEFTDNPKQGGEEIQLEVLPVYKQAPLPTATLKSSPRKEIKKLKTVKASYYTSLKIISPEANSAIRNNAGNVTVKVQLSPALRKDTKHQIEYLLNGKVVKKGGLTVTLSNVDRGAHLLQVRVVDAKGKVLISSCTVSFNLKRYFKPKAQKSPAPRQDPNAFLFEDDA